jgi:hypothetical protein
MRHSMLGKNHATTAVGDASRRPGFERLRKPGFAVVRAPGWLARAASRLAHKFATVPVDHAANTRSLREDIQRRAREKALVARLAE